MLSPCVPYELIISVNGLYHIKFSLLKCMLSLQEQPTWMFFSLFLSNLQTKKKSPHWYFCCPLNKWSIWYFLSWFRQVFACSGAGISNGWVSRILLRWCLFKSRSSESDAHVLYFMQKFFWTLLAGECEG